MATVDMKHTLRVDRNAWYIRFYLWLWEGDVHQISFCKLFWAYAFAVPGLILRGFVEAVALAVKPVVRRGKERKRAALASAPLPPVSVPRGPSRMQRFLSRIENGGSRLVYVGSVVWDMVSRHKRLNRVLVRGAAGVGLLISAALVLGLGYLIVTHLSAALLVLVGVVSVVAVIVTFALMHALGVLDALWRKVFVRAGHGAKGGLLGFGAVMRLGYHAVKSNTCPRIEVVGNDDEC